MEPDQLQISQPGLNFGRSDCEVLGRYPTRIRWLEVPAAEQQERRSIRERLRVLAQLGAAIYPGATVVRPFVSLLTPNGRAPRDYWSCIFPVQVPNKSFGLQIAFILRADGAEMCFCVGAGSSQEKKDQARETNDSALRAMRSRLAALPANLADSVSRRLGTRWHLRKHWREVPGDDFASLQQWIDHAASIEGTEASVSRYYTAAELDDAGDDIATHFQEAVEVFAPIMDFVYEAPGELLPTKISADSESVITTPATHTDRAGSTRTWCIATGEGGHLWPELSEKSFVAIGMRGLRVDLRSFTSKESIAEALVPLSDPGVAPTNEALCGFQFAHEMQVGDRILAKRGMSEITGYGVVSGDYKFDATRAEYPHVREVAWLSKGSWSLPDDRRVPMKTLTDVSSYDKLLGFVMPLVHAAPATTGGELATETPEPPLYSIEDALEGLFVDREQFEQMRDTLARKKNLIIQGPPGVGKTFVARRLAYAMMGYKAPHRVQMIQFHQSYGYEDFVQGWRPAKTGGFRLKDGVFYEFCKRAQADPRSTYVFIIDEINRGNLSKIFGELMMLVEADKRSSEYAVPLTYAEEGDAPFHVPENVHLIGMMNTADRSLAMVDYALRRRFAFVRLEPAFESARFEQYLIARGASPDLVERIVDRMGELNGTILSEEKTLGAGFEIGHSFFCVQGTEQNLDEDWYHAVIRSEIQPLLHEYWFDDNERVEQLVQQLVA